jgi:hypothetical protein
MDPKVDPNLQSIKPAKITESLEVPKVINVDGQLCT